MWRIVPGSILAAVVVGLVVTGCAGSGKPALKATFSRDDAIARAMMLARGAQPEISGALEGPRNPQAELLTLGEANHRVFGQAQLAPGESPDQAVWLVTLEGAWRDESSRPTGIPTPVLWHHYYVIIDANTGEFLSSTAGP